MYWLANGDRNTKFFHRKASNRRTRNILLGLFDKDGVWQDSDLGMEGVMLSYFQDIFTTANLDLAYINSVVELFQPKVTVDMNRDLCADYSVTEIKNALFQMYPTKAPGPDGMPPFFFQHFWETIGPDIVSAVHSFLHTSSLLR